MKKKFKFLTLILVLLLALSLMFVAACQSPETDNDDDDTDKTETSTDIVSNGSFGTTTSTETAYLKTTVSGWTKTSASTSVSTSSSEDYVAGIIDLANTELFASENSSTLEGLATNPGVSANSPKTDGKYNDTNALILALPTTAGSFYYKNSSTITVAKGKYYEISIDVCTNIVERAANQGAYIMITAGGQPVQFKAIDTAGAWATYTTYIQANNFEDRTVTIELWIGHGSDYAGYTVGGSNSADTNANPRLTKGIVYFDNVTVTAVGADKYEAKATAETLNANEAAVSLYYADQGFTAIDAYTYTTTYYSYDKYYYSVKYGVSSSYTGVTGKVDLEDSSEFPTSYGTTHGGTAGIIDMSQLYTFGTKDDGTATETDMLHALISSIKGPDFADFYTDGKFAINSENRANDLKETLALMIYHPDYAVSGYGFQSDYDYLIEKDKYYTISVWVYIWAPAYGKTAPTEVKKVEEPKKSDYYADVENPTTEEKSKYETAYDAWENYETYKTELQAYTDAKDYYEKQMEAAKATFKMTGISVDDANDLSVDGGELGEWKQLTINVKGNDLSNRQVGFEFWYGEGEWGSTGLYPGGAIFDNLSISVSTEPTSGLTEDSYTQISPILEDDYSGFGLNSNTDATTVTEIGAETGIWGFEFEDDDSEAEYAGAYIVPGNMANDSEAWSGQFDGLDIPGTMAVKGTAFNTAMLYNKNYTATSLTCKPLNGEKMLISALPNSFYRLSLWIRTDDIDSDLGVTAGLYNAEDDSKLDTLDSINTDGVWEEVSFIIKGAVFSEKELYVKFTMGEGDIYTPAKHVKGVMYATAFTWVSVSYDEYSNAAKGDYISTYELSDSISTSNTVTNGYFGLLNTSNYSSDDMTEIFNEKGELIGAAVPASWTATAASTGLLSTIASKTEKTIPQNVTMSGDTLSWTKVPDAKKYYIFIGPVDVKGTDDKTYSVSKVLIASVDAIADDPDDDTDSKQSTTIPYYGAEFIKTTRYLYVQAYNDNSADGKKQTGLSGFSSSCKYSLTEGTAETAPSSKDETEGSKLDDITSEFGIIDYTTYAGKFKASVDADNFYNADVADDGKLYYKSTQSDGVLMMSSNYLTRGGYTSASKSISSGSYYVLSVWVKTVGTTTASITISNSSSVFAANKNQFDGNSDITTNEDYIGYVDINTADKWQQFRFYIKNESPTSATVKLELWFGNKYASNTKTAEDADGYTRTIYNGLTTGTVFFDDVSFTTLADEDAFNALLVNKEGTNDKGETEIKDVNTYFTLSDLNNEYFSNKYMYQILNYTTDSFDEFTAVSEETKPLQGGTPDNYTHAVDDEATDYAYDSKADSFDPEMLYGVYTNGKLPADLVSKLIGSDLASVLGDGFTEEALTKFLKTDYGEHFLMMANLKENGQSYYSSSITLSSATYYKITFSAKTWLADGAYADFRFIYGNDTENYSSIRISGDKWTDYTIYIHNDQDSSISSNMLYFYLGYDEDSKGTIDDPTNFMQGLLLVDNVSVVKLADNTDYTNAIKDYNKLSTEEKLSAGTITYEFEKTTTSTDTNTDTDTDTDTNTDDNTNKINSQVWLLVASVVIGAVLIAVVVVMIYRKVKKRIKITPPPVESKVPVNMNKPISKKKISNKKDINDDTDFTDNDLQ